MKIYGRKFLAAVAVVAVGTSLAGCSASQRPQEPYQINLGVIDSPDSYPTSAEAAAIRLAVAEINSADKGINITLVAAEPFVPGAEETAPDDSNSAGEAQNPDAQNAEQTEQAEPPANADGTNADGTNADGTNADEGHGTDTQPTDTPSNTPTEAVLPESELSSLFAKQVNAILAPSSLVISQNMVKEAVKAEIPILSTAQSDPEAYNWVTNGLYIRTAPSVRALGQAVAEQMILDDRGFIGLIGINNYYSALIRDGINWEIYPTTGQVVAESFYEPGSYVFNSAADLVLAKKPNALAVITQDESQAVLNLLLGAGYSAENMYLVGDSAKDYTGQLTHPLTGAQAFSAQFTAPEEFKTKLSDYLTELSTKYSPQTPLAPTETDFSAAARAYDTVRLYALGVLKAGGPADDAKVSQAIFAISGGHGLGEDPVKFTDFAEAAEQIFSGTTVDFDGYSGGLALANSGELDEVKLTRYVYDAESSLQSATEVLLPNPEFSALLSK